MMICTAIAINFVLDTGPVIEKKKKKRLLLPCVKAEWTDKGKQLRIVLTEGRKHHIRRVCRELLGYHVIDLQRIRIGPIEIGNLPQGHWRPITQSELSILLQ